MSYTHTCSCGQIYTDDDPDLYCCPECAEKRKALAKQVDQQVASRPSRRSSMSDYQIALQKGRATETGLFVRASDLGL